MFLELIVLPRVLRGLLEEVDEGAAAGLALDFAEQCIRDTGAGVVPAGLAETAIGYLAAARAHLGGGGMAELASAHQRYFDARDQADQLPAAITWIAVIAVRVACQRDLEAAGVVARVRHVPTVAGVTDEAQAIAGLAAGKGDDGHRARWEAARRQLVLLINAVPVPGS